LTVQDGVPVRTALPFLGLFPLGLGVKAAVQVWRHRPDDAEEAASRQRAPGLLEVAVWVAAGRFFATRPVIAKAARPSVTPLTTSTDTSFKRCPVRRGWTRLGP